MNEALVRIPWGSWDAETGWWSPNPLLSMSRDEQLAQNIANGYPERIQGMREVSAVRIVPDDALGIRLEPA